MVDPLSYFSYQPVLHDWCIKGRGLCYSVCGMMHIGGIAPNQVIARSEFEVHRQMFTERL